MPPRTLFLSKCLPKAGLVLDPAVPHLLPNFIDQYDVMYSMYTGAPNISLTVRDTDRIFAKLFDDAAAYLRLPPLPFPCPPPLPPPHRAYTRTSDTFEERMQEAADAVIARETADAAAAAAAKMTPDDTAVLITTTVITTLLGSAPPTAEEAYAAAVAGSRWAGHVRAAPRPTRAVMAALAEARRVAIAVSYMTGEQAMADFLAACEKEEEEEEEADSEEEDIGPITKRVSVDEKAKEEPEDEGEGLLVKAIDAMHNWHGLYAEPGEAWRDVDRETVKVWVKRVRRRLVSCQAVYNFKKREVEDDSEMDEE